MSVDDSLFEFNSEQFFLTQIKFLLDKLVENFIKLNFLLESEGKYRFIIFFVNFSKNYKTLLIRWSYTIALKYDGAKIWKIILKKLKFIIK